MVVATPSNQVREARQVSLLLSGEHPIKDVAGAFDWLLTVSYGGYNPDTDSRQLRGPVKSQSSAIGLTFMRIRGLRPIASYMRTKSLNVDKQHRH